MAVGRSIPPPRPTCARGTARGVPKPCRLATSAALRALVAAKLAADWSPQQIAGWLKQTFPDHPHLQVSHETIYVSLFVQSRGVLKKELFTHLRRRRRMRQARQATTAGQARGRIIDAVSIRERPAEAADRAVPGHWEGDLLSGARNSHIATLVERRSRVVRECPTGSRKSAATVNTSYPTFCISAMLSSSRSRCAFSIQRCS